MWKCPTRIRNLNWKFECFPEIRQRIPMHSCVFIFCSFLLLHSNSSFSEETATSSESSDWYGYLYLGDNLGGSNTGKLKSVDYKGGGPYEWGIGIGRHFSDTFSIEGTFEYWGERYERSGPIIPGTENNVIQAGGLGLSASAIVNFHLENLHGYLGAGAGYYITGILVTEPGSGLLTDEGAPSDKWLPGFHVSIGADYRVKDSNKVGIEIKHRMLKADFGEYTNGEVDVGGTFILLMYRHSNK